MGGRENSRQSSPGEFYASLFLLRVNAARGCCEDILQPPQPWGKLLSFLLDISVLLGNCQLRVEVIGNDLTS